MEPALLDQTQHVPTTLGFGEVGRAAWMLLFDNLNDEIDKQSDRWKEPDLALQELTGGNVGEVELEHVEPQNFHASPHKSIINAPPEAFPNVSVMAYATMPSTDPLDQIEGVQLRLYIECCAKAGPVTEGNEVDFETIVHRRIERMTEAVNTLVMRNKEILGVAHPGIELPPRGGIGQQSWVKHKEGNRGPRYLWQGSRLEYQLSRQAIF